MRIGTQLLFGLTAFVAVLSPAAGAGADRKTITIRSGQEVTLAIGKAGAVSETARGAASALDPFETAVVRQFVGGDFRQAVGANSAPISEGEGGIPESDPVDPNIVRIKFATVRGGHSLLIIENGYGKALTYRAVIRKGRRSQPTDVCQVPPASYGFEHWPYAIDQIDLSGLRLGPWTEGQAPVCE
jgi:hypothetical protein